MAEQSYPLITPGASTVSVESGEEFGPVDHVEIGVDRLLWQYANSPKLKAYLTALLNAVQPLEDLAWELWNERQLAVAVGAQLDVLGRIVQVQRGSFGDTDYRALIAVKIALNKPAGVVSQLYQVVSMLTGTIRAWDEYPAILHTEWLGYIYAYWIYDMMRSLWKPAGITWYFRYSKEATDIFQKSPTYATVVTSSTKGYDSYYATTGGKYCGVFV